MPVVRTASARGDVAGQHLIEPGALVAGEAEADRGVALRVGVDQQRLVARLGDAGGDVDGRGGLADAALLVRDRVDGAHCALETSERGGGDRAVNGRFAAIPGRRG